MINYMINIGIRAKIKNKIYFTLILFFINSQAFGEPLVANSTNKAIPLGYRYFNIESPACWLGRFDEVRFNESFEACANLCIAAEKLEKSCAGIAFKINTYEAGSPSATRGDCILKSALSYTIFGTADVLYECDAADPRPATFESTVFNLFVYQQHNQNLEKQYAIDDFSPSYFSLLPYPRVLVVTPATATVTSVDSIIKTPVDAPKEKLLIYSEGNPNQVELGKITSGEGGIFCKTETETATTEFPLLVAGNKTIVRCFAYVSPAAANQIGKCYVKDFSKGKLSAGGDVTTSWTEHKAATVDQLLCSIEGGSTVRAALGSVAVAGTTPIAATTTTVTPKATTTTATTTTTTPTVTPVATTTTTVTPKATTPTATTTTTTPAVTPVAITTTTVTPKATTTTATTTTTTPNVTPVATTTTTVTPKVTTTTATTTTITPTLTPVATTTTTATPNATTTTAITTTTTSAPAVMPATTTTTTVTPKATTTAATTTTTTPVVTAVATTTTTAAPVAASTTTVTPTVTTTTPTVTQVATTTKVVPEVATTTTMPAVPTVTPVTVSTTTVVPEVMAITTMPASVSTPTVVPAPTPAPTVEPVTTPSTVTQPVVPAYNYELVFPPKFDLVTGRAVLGAAGTRYERDPNYPDGSFCNATSPYLRADLNPNSVFYNITKAKKRSMKFLKKTTAADRVNDHPQDLLISDCFAACDQETECTYVLYSERSMKCYMFKKVADDGASLTNAGCSPFVLSKTPSGVITKRNTQNKLISPNDQKQNPEGYKYYIKRDKKQ